MANQAGSDAVLQPLDVRPDGIRFRLGIGLRSARRGPGPADARIPARYVRVQIASPPPARVRGGQSSNWNDGLHVDGVKGKRQFQPGGNDWADLAVSPAAGIPQLGPPHPDTILFDQWVAVPAVPATEAPARVFKMAGPRAGDTAILSVHYDQPMLNGEPLEWAGVSHYLLTTLEFEFGRTAGRWLAVSFEQFQPERRQPSADYILKVDERASITELPPQREKIERWW
jgi:hypothetical protein